MWKKNKIKEQVKHMRLLTFRFTSCKFIVFHGGCVSFSVAHTASCFTAKSLLLACQKYLILTLFILSIFIIPFYFILFHFALTHFLLRSTHRVHTWHHAGSNAIWMHFRRCIDPGFSFSESLLQILIYTFSGFTTYIFTRVSFSFFTPCLFADSSVII